MKLIDLLVRETNKNGWEWPDDVSYIEQYVDNTLFGDNGYESQEKYKRCDDYGNDYVTRDQYQSALAASQKVEWDGAGLPPVGIEVESAQPGQINWTGFKVIAVDSGAVFGFWSNGVASALDGDRWLFRHIRSEADKKRDDRATAIDGFICGFRKQKTGSNKELAYALTDYLALIDKLQ